MGAAVHRHLPLVELLQKGGLRAWRGPVQFVHQDDVGEDRAGDVLQRLVLPKAN